MWFHEVDTNIICLCGNHCAKGFPKCHQCLPSRDELLLHYELLNANHENIHGWLCEKDSEYKTHISTNCALTASMIQKEFGFFIGEMELTEEPTKSKFFQIKLNSKKHIGVHMMTIIGDYIVHSFLEEFPLRIKKINQEWINALEAKNWSVICDYQFENIDGFYVTYYVPKSSYNYVEFVNPFDKFSRRLKFLQGK